MRSENDNASNSGCGGVAVLRDGGNVSNRETTTRRTRAAANGEEEDGLLARKATFESMRRESRSEE